MKQSLLALTFSLVLFPFSKANENLDLIQNRFVAAFKSADKSAVQFGINVIQPNFYDPFKSDATARFRRAQNGNIEAEFRVETASPAERFCALQQFNEFSKLAQRQPELIAQLQRAGVDTKHFAFIVRNQDFYTDFQAHDEIPALYKNLRKNQFHEAELLQLVGAHTENFALAASDEQRGQFAFSLDAPSIRALTFDLFRVETKLLSEKTAPANLMLANSPSEKIACYISSPERLHEQMQTKLDEAREVFNYENLLLKSP